VSSWNAGNPAPPPILLLLPLTISPATFHPHGSPRLRTLVNYQRALFAAV